jgi:hypothetical protein
MHLLKLLRKNGKFDPHTAIVDSVIVRAMGGGVETGPSPVDRRKLGSKHTLLVDRHCIPLAIRAASANTNDQTQILPIVLDCPAVGASRSNFRTSFTPNGATTARPPDTCFDGWASNR